MVIGDFDKTSQDSSPFQCMLLPQSAQFTFRLSTRLSGWKWLYFHV